MFGWLRRKDPRKELQLRYETRMREARDIQRRGDIVAYAAKVAEADEIRRRLDALDGVGRPDGAALDKQSRHG